MNRERVLKLADVIEEHPENFYIGSWITIPKDAPGWLELIEDSRRYCSGSDQKVGMFTSAAAAADLASCGTTACIAGWAVYLWAAEADENKSVPSNAIRILDLNSEQRLIFYAGSEAIPNAKTAAARLRQLVREDIEAEETAA